MSNNLIITCMAFGKDCYGFTAADDYGNVYEANWADEAAFKVAFPDEASLIRHVADIDEMGFLGIEDSDNKWGFSIESVTNIEIANFPGEADLGLGANTSQAEPEVDEQGAAAQPWANARHYSPRRRWAWNDEHEKAYLEKREKLAAKGYVTDEEVARYFAEQGEAIRPEDVRAIFLDSISESPLAKVLRELS